jgi:hypothetical protein
VVDGGVTTTDAVLGALEGMANGSSVGKGCACGIPEVSTFGEIGAGAGDASDLLGAVSCFGASNLESKLSNFEDFCPLDAIGVAWHSRGTEQTGEGTGKVEGTSFSM